MLPALRRAFTAAVLLAVLGPGPARADWLWIDDSRPDRIVVEANGFTLSPLLVESARRPTVLTAFTYSNHRVSAGKGARVSFSGVFTTLA